MINMNYILKSLSILLILVLAACSTADNGSSPSGDSDYEDWEVETDSDDELGENGNNYEIGACTSTCREGWEYDTILKLCRPINDWLGDCGHGCNGACPEYAGIDLACQSNICTPQNEDWEHSLVFESFDGGCNWQKVAAWIGTDVCTRIELLGFEDYKLFCTRYIGMEDNRKEAILMPPAKNGIQTHVALVYPEPDVREIFPWCTGSDPSVLYTYWRNLEGAIGYYRSVDLGISWESFPAVLGDNLLEIQDLVATGNDGNRIVANTKTFGLQRSLDGGNSWIPGGPNIAGEISGYQQLGECATVKIDSLRWAANETELMANLQCRNGSLETVFNNLARASTDTLEWSAYKPSYMDEYTGQRVSGIFMSHRLPLVAIASILDNAVFVENSETGKVTKYPGAFVNYIKDVMFAEDAIYFITTTTVYRADYISSEVVALEEDFPHFSTECYTAAIQKAWLDPQESAHLKVFISYIKGDCLIPECEDGDNIESGRI